MPINQNRRLLPGQPLGDLEEGPDDGMAAEEEHLITSEQLTEEERKVVERLKERIREVRAHKQAHVVSGGQ